MKSCPYCAEEIQDAAVICKHCGRDLSSGVVPAVAKRTPPKKKSRLGLIVAVVVVPIALLVVLGWLATSTPTPTSVGFLQADATRDTLLQRAIVGTGEPCADVKRVYRPTTAGKDTAYQVDCGGTHTYALNVDADGKVTVATCAVMAVAAKITCFKPFSEQ